jgi:hypothetical protein
MNRKDAPSAVAERPFGGGWAKPKPRSVPAETTLKACGDEEEIVYPFYG